MKELSDSQIAKYFHSPKFGGVINKNSLERLRRKVYIANMDRKNGHGTHWVMISNLSPNYVYYFDSFGVPMPEHLLKLAKKTNKTVIQNTQQVQSMTSNSCGEFCVFVANQLIQGRKPMDIMKMFSQDTSYNEHVLQDYFV